MNELSAESKEEISHWKFCSRSKRASFGPEFTITLGVDEYTWQLRMESLEGIQTSEDGMGEWITMMFFSSHKRPSFKLFISGLPG